jgi:hypothetical protein
MDPDEIPVDAALVQDHAVFDVGGVLIAEEVRAGQTERLRLVGITGFGEHFGHGLLRLGVERGVDAQIEAIEVIEARRPQEPEQLGANGRRSLLGHERDWFL